MSIKFKSAQYTVTVTRGEETKSFSQEAQRQGNGTFEIVMNDDGALHMIELQFAS